jgi:hypothetical protein
MSKTILNQMNYDISDACVEINPKHIKSSTVVTNINKLKELQRVGLITLDPLTTKFKYIDTFKYYYFKYKDTYYQCKFVDGCFNPYVFELELYNLD